MFGAYKERREEHGVQLYGSLGIARNDAGRAPRPVQEATSSSSTRRSALFITIDRRLGPGQWADLGGYIHALMFLARGYGLDTCPQEAWARLYKTVGAFLKLPADEMLFCGMAIGYGDRKHKANDFRSPRAELDEFCTSGIKAPAGMFAVPVSARAAVEDAADHETKHTDTDGRCLCAEPQRFAHGC